MPRARESGSWVSEPIDVFDGEKRTYIYKRPKTKKWQLYIKTENEGVIRESTKQEDQEEALTYARERWYEIQGRQRSGLKVKREKKLFDFAEEFLEEEESELVVFLEKELQRKPSASSGYIFVGCKSFLMVVIPS